MTDTSTLETHDAAALFERLGIPREAIEGGDIEVRTPITGEPIAHVHSASAADADAAIGRAAQAFLAWREVPAPRRGELVRLFGEELRAEKDALGALVTLEAGKITQEGLGEVQEMIDVCDFAVGLSRQLYGLTIASERPGHRMSETRSGSSPHSTSRSPYGAGTRRWPWSAATRWSGSRRPAHR